MTLESELHPEKESPPRLSTEEGMIIEESEPQHPNTNDSRHKSREPDSNETLRSPQSQKHWRLRLPTDEGMQIDDSERQEVNAFAPNCESLEPDSNVTVERARQKWKQ
jgi:hypothetical protein